MNDRLYAGQALVPGGQLLSANGKYQLIYQTDGNLVGYTLSSGSVSAPVPFWSSGAQNGSPGIAVMQADGNLVLYDAANHPYWASNTGGVGAPPSYKLFVQDDRNIVIYDSNGKAIWASNTWTPESK